MKFIIKHLPLIGILLLTIFVGAAAGLYFDVPARLQKASKQENPSQQYICPMHPEVVSNQPGSCPKCGMALTLASEPQSAHSGCGATGETEQHGCCAKPPPAELNLPPGHPPIPGQNAHAGCATTTEAAPSPEKSSK